jgi:hypothetical protein
MRNALFIIIGLFCVNAATAAMAFDDGFGDRFYNQAPQALGDYTAEETEIQDVAMDDFANELQSIQPASGDEEAPSSNENEAE